MSGYARAIGHTTHVSAKLCELQDEINLCIELNLANVLIELDVVKLWELRDEINLYIELNLANILIELDAKLMVDMLMKYKGK